MQFLTSLLLTILALTHSSTAGYFQLSAQGHGAWEGCDLHIADVCECTARIRLEPRVTCAALRDLGRAYGKAVKSCNGVFTLNAGVEGTPVTYETPGCAAECELGQDLFGWNPSMPDSASECRP